jgi:5-methylthioadenosine/S-adenosylhomocysteine deaminase
MRMATLGGAELLGLDDICGSIVPGKQADLCVVDTSSSRMTPVYEPWTHLVFVTRGSDIRHTLVAGRVLYRDRRLTSIDEDAAKRDVRALAADIAAAVG